jgi:hypothetical protein
MLWSTQPNKYQNWTINMTNRIPLIVNAGAGQIQEITSTDVLQVPGNLVANVVQTDNYQYANGVPISFSGTYGNANVETLLNSGAFTGNIVPAGNATQSLGNATNQWLDLWVSNSTIYLNSIPLGVSNTGVLQFDGNDIVTSGPNVINTGNVETTGNVVGGNVVIATGGGLTFADGSVQTTAYGNANVEVYLPVSNTIIAINANVANTNGNVANLTTSLGNTNGNVANLTITVSNQANAIGNLQGAVYANSNVATFLANFGANTITTTGDISAGNATLTNLYSPNFFANAIVYANAAGYLTNTNLFKYDPGTEVLTVKAVSANVLAGEGGNISNITGANVTGAVSLATAANSLISGNSGVEFAAPGANIELTVGGVAIADISSNTIGVNGTVRANILAGEGGNISNIQGANVSGEVASANVVTNPSQTAITQVGTLTSLTTGSLTTTGQFTANANAQFNGDVYFAGNVTIPGNINQISGNSASFFGNAVTGFGALYAGLACRLHFAGSRSCTVLYQLQRLHTAFHAEHQRRRSSHWRLYCHSRQRQRHYQLH